MQNIENYDIDSAWEKFLENGDICGDETLNNSHNTVPSSH